MPEFRLQFSKTDTACYLSHLDLMRTFQRAFQRAGIAIRHTEGFNPHPYVSILLPLPVGFSSCCEILEFGLEEELSPREVTARMCKALPAGITVHRCYPAVRPAKELAYAQYIITMEYENGVPKGAVNEFRKVLGQESLVIRKKSKKAKSGWTELDIIPLIGSLSFDEREDCITAIAVLQAQNPGLNPELLTNALYQACPGLAPDYTSFHRKAVLDGNMEQFE